MMMMMMMTMTMDDDDDDDDDLNFVVQNRANFISCEQKYQVTAPSNQTDCVNFRTNTLFCLATK